MNMAPTLPASRGSLPPEGANFPRGGPSENWTPTLAAYEINGQPASAQAFYAVACDPRRSVAVEACAGAGKTWMLVSRIVRALLDGAEPHEILAITFTKRAAGEMRARLQQWLQDFSQASDAQLDAELSARGLQGKNGEKPLPELREQLSKLYQAVLQHGRPVQVRTFHSWFAALLRNAPLAVLEQLGLPANYELLEDDAEAQALVWRRFYAALAQQPAQRAEFEAAVFQHGRSQTEKALSTALGKRLEFGLADAAGVVDASVQPFTAQWADFAGCAEPGSFLLQDPTRWAQVKEAARLLGLASAPSFAAKGVELEQAWSAGNVPGVLAALLTQAGTARKFGDKIDGITHIRQVQELALRVQAAQEQHDAWQHHQRMASLTRLLVAEFAALKRERGWVDMNDVERAAALMLGDPVLSGWVQQRLDARVRHLLIDEFQDTSPLQWQALSSWLSAYAGSGAGDAPSVFLVGDPKQSIYRFRRAEPQVFMAAQQFVRQGLGGDVLCCDHTRRNAPQVIEAVNAAMLSACAAGEYGNYRAHTTAREAPGQVLRLPPIPRSALARDEADAWTWRDSLATPQSEAEETLRTLEARQAAQWVAAQIGQGVPPSQIMVLSRRRAGLAPMRDELRALGIAAQVAEKTGLIETCEVQDIVALLDVLVSPLHDLSLARVLKSPLFGWSDDGLIALAKAVGQAPPGERAGWLETLQNQELTTQYGQGAGPILARWKAWVAQLPPHDALQAIYTDGDVLARYAAAAPAHLRASVLANLQALPAAALQLGGGRFATPYGFVRALKSGGVEAHSALAADAVRLLTIHGAKGLEADVVLLLDTDANPRSSDTMAVLVDWPGEAAHPARFAFLASEAHPPACAVEAMATERAARGREELNALYVAMTRACGTLVVSGIEPYKESKEGPATWWARLQPLAEPIPGGEAGPVVSATGMVPVSPLPAFDLKILPKALVPSTLSATENVAGSSPRGVAGGVTAGIGKEDLEADSDASRIGQAMHRLLQWSGVAGIDAAASQAAVAREFGLSVAQSAAAAQMAGRILKGEGAWAWDAEQLAWAGDEVELHFEGALLRLDRLVQRRGSGQNSSQWWVLDHKSASQPHRDAALVAQLAQYRRAVQALQGGVVRAAFLTAEGRLIEIGPDAEPPPESRDA